jgi:hypothetical protein
MIRSCGSLLPLRSGSRRASSHHSLLVVSSPLANRQ